MYLFVLNTRSLLFKESHFDYRSNRASSSARGGPMIREVEDDEDGEEGNHKRRKGVFGRLFKANDD